jgi:hypothetical protein
MAIITHIELETAGEVYRIAASVKSAPSDIRKGMVITDIRGMLNPGEISEDPQDRSYSDGSVWNENAVRKGKDISIPITIYGDTAEEARAIYNDFEIFCSYGTSYIALRTYGRRRDYNCQFQNLPSDDEADDGTSIDVTLLLKAAEVY